MGTNQNGNANSCAKDRSREGWCASLGVLIGFSLILLAVSLFQGWSLLTEIAIVLLGSMVTAIITHSLLKSQTEEAEKLQRSSEELILDREKNTKVYEEKLKVYKAYLQELCKVLETRKISDEQQIKLQFQIAAIAMHTPYYKIKEVSDSLVKMLQCIKGQNGQGQAVEFMEPLLDIVRTFKTELYLKTDSKEIDGDKIKKEKENIINEIIKNFQEAFKDTDTDGAPASDNAGCSEEIKDGQFDELQKELLDELNVAPEYRNKSCWSGKDWSYCKLFSDGLKWTNQKGQGIVEIGFYQGHYYMQANYPGETDFAKALKLKYGGYRSYGQWWKHLDEFSHIKEGEFLQNLKKEETLQRAVTEWCDKLMKELEAYKPNSKQA